MSRSHQKGGEPSQRMLRVAELIRHAVAQLLARGEINDPDLVGLVVTVPSVRMSPDLKLATVYIMPLGGQRQEEICAILDRHKKFLRGEIAHQVNLKYRARNPLQGGRELRQCGEDRRAPANEQGRARSSGRPWRGASEDGADEPRQDKAS